MLKNFNLEAAIIKLRDYWASYGYWKNTVGETFLQDALYGIGLALDEERYKGTKGFRLFKKDLYEKLEREQRENFKTQLKTGRKT